MTKNECFRDVNEFFQFQDWSISDGAGWYGLASAFVLNGIADDEFVRVRAAIQRKLFGRVVFGKQCVKINSRTGSFQTIKSQAFGGDFDAQDHYPAHYYVKDGVWNRRENAVW